MFLRKNKLKIIACLLCLMLGASFLTACDKTETKGSLVKDKNHKVEKDETEEEAEESESEAAETSSKTDDVSAEPEDSEPEVTETEATEDTVETEETTVETEATEVTETSESEVEVEVTEVTESTEPTNDTEDTNPDANVLEVTNNSSYFVQIGDKIYFHMPEESSLSNTAMWADYSTFDCGRTVLMEYTPSTGEVKKVTDDYVSGEIYVQGGTLYTRAYDDSDASKEYATAYISGYSLDGSESTIGTPNSFDYILGAGPEGEFIAVYNYEYIDNELSNKILIYKDGELVNTVVADGYNSRIKLDSDDFYYIAKVENPEDDDDTTFELRQLNMTTGEVIRLGVLPNFEYSMWAGEIDECLIEGDKIYFSYSFYDGTGHFFQEGRFITAEIGVPDSMTINDMPEFLYYEEPIAAPFAVQNGEMVATDGVPDTCNINSDGVLGYFDENGVWNPVADGWGVPSYEADYQGVELAEKIGDSIYLIYNSNIRAPEEDIGWRYAYSRDFSSIYRVSIASGEATEIARVSK